ncbi:hypothetical protein [Streptomyces sp. NPDC050535]|uniref:hypothetical protein n=1 Tax=Streptomyces sp. NPDC050535 TaxID=3365626 RepID=UPI003798B0C5
MSAKTSSRWAPAPDQLPGDLAELAGPVASPAEFNALVGQWDLGDEGRRLRSRTRMIGEDGDRWCKSVVLAGGGVVSVCCR